MNRHKEHKYWETRQRLDLRSRSGGGRHIPSFRRDKAFPKAFVGGLAHVKLQPFTFDPLHIISTYLLFFRSTLTRTWFSFSFFFQSEYMLARKRANDNDRRSNLRYHLDCYHFALPGYDSRNSLLFFTHEIVSNKILLSLSFRRSFLFHEKSTPKKDRSNWKFDTDCDGHHGSRWKE